MLLSFTGDCDEAVELVRKNKELSSAEGCISCIPSRLMSMARIYANCGRYGEAIDELEAVLSLNTYVTVNTLKYNHWIDPFRDHPRYQVLIEKHKNQRVRQ